MSTKVSADEIPLYQLSTSQLQRAWALLLVKQLWPTIKPTDGLTVARWIYDNRKVDADG